jgi:hypothetical protein
LYKAGRARSEVGTGSLTFPVPIFIATRRNKQG